MRPWSNTTEHRALPAGMTPEAVLNPTEHHGCMERDSVRKIASMRRGKTPRSTELFSMDRVSSFRWLPMKPRLAVFPAIVGPELQ